MKTLNLTSKLLLACSAVIFPAAILLPFMLHSDQFYQIIAYGSANGSAPTNCSVSSPPTNYQCGLWEAPQSLWFVTTGLLVLVTIFSLALSWYALRRTHQEAKVFVDVRFKLASLVAGLSLVVYGLLRVRSENNGFAPGAESSQGDFASLYDPLVGFGVLPVMAVLLTIAYLVPPLLNWYRFRYSNHHVGGQKKQDLFK